MLKITVLYKHPEDPQAFERYYAETHLPLARKMALSRMELTRFGPGPDGARPEYYRMAELYFSDEQHMQRVLSSPEGQAAVDDLSNFATGGVTLLAGAVEA